MSQVDTMILSLRGGAKFSNPQAARIAQLSDLSQSHIDGCNALLLTLTPTDPNYAVVVAFRDILIQFQSGSSSTLGMLQVHTDFLSGAGNGKFPHDELVSVVAQIPVPPDLALLVGLGAIGAVGHISDLTPEKALKHLTFPSALGAMSGAERIQSGSSFFVPDGALPACAFMNTVLGSVTGAIDDALKLISDALANMNDILNQGFDYVRQIEQAIAQIEKQIVDELTELVNNVILNILNGVAGLLHSLSIDPCFNRLMSQVAPGLIIL